MPHYSHITITLLPHGFLPARFRQYTNVTVHTLPLQLAVSSHHTTTITITHTFYCHQITNRRNCSTQTTDSSHPNQTHFTLHQNPKPHLPNSSFVIGCYKHTLAANSLKAPHSHSLLSPASLPSIETTPPMLYSSTRCADSYPQAYNRCTPN